MQRGMVMCSLSGYSVGVHDFTKLSVWISALDLTEHIYQLTGRFPRSELFGLTSQARRAAVSVCANLAEGSARPSDADFARFVGLSAGSLAELESHLVVAARLRLVDPVGSDEVRQEVKRLRSMLQGLYERLTVP